MYSVGTYEMAQALALDFLGWLPPFFLYAALVAWAAAFIGLLRQLARRLLAGAG
jgi:hypothetical protein